MPRNQVNKESRSLIYKNDDTEYGIVTKKLGNGRFKVRLNLKKEEVIGRLCGKFRKGSSKKQNWVDIDSVVLVGIRDFQENTVDIIHVYDSNEARQLRKSGEIIDISDAIKREEIFEEDQPFIFEQL